MDSRYHPTNEPEDDSLNLKRYFSLFLSNWYWFAVSLFMALTISYSINRYSNRIFSASSTLLIKSDLNGGISSNAASVIPGGDIFKNQQNLVNEIGILKSFSLNYRVIEKLKDFHVVYTGVGRRGIVETTLYKSCPFKVVYDSLELQPHRRVWIDILSDNSIKLSLNDGQNSKDTIDFGERFKKYGFDFTIVQRDSGSIAYDRNTSNRYYFYFADPVGLAYQYQGKLSVSPIEEESSIVTLSLKGQVGEQEVDYLNMLMEEYIAYGLENKRVIADSTMKFIDEQIDVISDSLKISEAELEDFRKSNNFFDLEQEGATIQNKLEKLDNERTSLEMQRNYYNYLNEYLKLQNSTGSIISPSVMGITDEVLLNLINELSVIKNEKEILSFNLEANQPAIELLDKKIEETKLALMENIRNNISGIKLSIDDVNYRISSVDTLVNKLPTMEKRFINIQRNFDLNNTVFTYLLEKRAESGIARASNLADNRIIDYASFAGPIKPKKRNNYLLAFILGIILPMTAIALMDFFNDKVIDKKDVERMTRVPIIGYISHSSGTEELAVVEKPKSALAESFRSVRTELKYFIKKREAAVIAVSSIISSEGKTFISSNLAAITAMVGKKVLLIGLDLRKPRLNKVFEFEDSTGMSTYLSENCEFEDVIKKTRVENLFYAPSGPIPPNPSELIETERMKTFIERAKKEFEYIIIDTPPVAIVTDALLLSGYVDINLFIVRQRYSSQNILELIENMRRQGELKNMAIVINDINLSGYYGYGIRYGYSQGYGYYYGSNYYSKGYYGRYDKKKDAGGYYTED